MTGPLRVLLVTDYDYPTGGIEQFVFQMLVHLQGRFECSVLTWSHGAPVPADSDQVICVEHGDIRTVWAALDAADIVVVVASFNVRLLAHIVLDCLLGRPKPMITVVQTSAHSDPNTGSAQIQLEWFEQLVAASRTVVAVSEDVAMAVRAVAVRAGATSSVVVVENAARLRGLRPVSHRRTVVGFIGRPHPQKGFPFFERLARTLSPRGLEFVANTVSLPPPRPVPEIKFSYNCTDSQLLEFFCSLDLLVAPYLYADGLPLALQEALNCGVPVIGFDSPGVGILLRDHKQVVIEPTYGALESAVVAWQLGKLVLSPPLAGSVVGWDVQAGRYADLIQEALTGRGAQ